MANFVPGDASPIADIKPWSPDWSFLEQVYGVTQVRYDRGFNMVKNLYNSVLNSPLTNSDNQSFRNEMFQKIQNSLKSVSALDLSNPTNVMRAQQLLNPITDDKELAYDMYVTKHHNSQKELLNAAKNSLDPKIRDQYSDISKMDIYYAEDNLKNAKRGDGSIMSVVPRDFTPFTNANEYLNEEAKKSKLKVTFSQPDGKGYIMKYTNGKYAEKPFSTWANTMLSAEKFSKQFEVIGRVTLESQTRELMAQGMTRQEAINKLATDYSKEYGKKLDTDVTQNNLSYNELDSKIKTIEKLYPNGVPSSRTDIVDQYGKLLQARWEVAQEMAQSKTEKKNLDADPVNYTSSNLASIYAKQAKKDAAIAWGVSTADATADVDMKPDQKVIADMNRAAANARHAATLKQQWAMHEDKMKFNQQKLARQEELAREKLKAEGKLPNETYVGTYLGTPITGVKALTEAGSRNREDLFNNAFGQQTGLMNIVLNDPKDHAKYYQVLTKVSQMSQNPNVKLTDSEKGILKEYTKLVNYEFGVPDINADNTAADAFIYDIAASTYSKAVKVAGTYTDVGKGKENKKYIQQFAGTISAMKGITQDLQNISSGYRNVANRIYDYQTNSLKSGFEGAKIISRLSDGTPVFDLSGLSEAQQQSLSQTIKSEFDTKTRPVGGIYTMTKPDNAELFAFFNTASTATITATGEKINPQLIANIEKNSISKMFGDQFEVSFDPGAEKAIIDLKLAPADEVTKQLKLPAGETIRVEIPYAQINSNKGLEKRLQKYVKQNSIGYDSYGILDAFSKNKYAKIDAPTYMEATGFDFVASGGKNAQGQYGVNLDFTMVDPSTKKKSTVSRFVKIDPSDTDSYSDASQVVNDAWTNYQIASDVWESQFDTEELVDLPDEEDLGLLSTDEE